MLSSRRAPTGETSGISRLHLWLGGLAATCFLLWALLATLGLLHYRARLDTYRAELREDRERLRTLRAEQRETLAAAEERAREVEVYRTRVSEVLQPLFRDAQPPRDPRAVLEALERLGPLLYSRRMTPEESARAWQRLRDLPGASAGGPVQTPEWVLGMQVLARHGLLAPERIPEAVDHIGRELYLDRVTTTPRPTPEPARVAGASPPPAAPPGHHYRNPSLGFAVRFPADWQVRDQDLPHAVLAQSPRRQDGLIDRGYVMVSGVELRQDLLEVEYAAQRVDSLRADNPGFTIEREGTLPLDGRPAPYTLGLHGGASAAMRTLSVVAVRSGKGYWLTFRCRADLYPVFEPVFLEILESFRANP
jgi:hypothetical protein